MEVRIEISCMYAFPGNKAVTSLVEVRIEISVLCIFVKLFSVTSLVEVRIEIYDARQIPWKIQSLPLWKCGLKFIGGYGSGKSYHVTSLVEVRIEINIEHLAEKIDERHFPCGSADWNSKCCAVQNKHIVTSLVEVRIEINGKKQQTALEGVTSLVEVRIEIKR